MRKTLTPLLWDCLQHDEHANMNYVDSIHHSLREVDVARWRRAPFHHFSAVTVTGQCGLQRSAGSGTARRPPELGVYCRLFHTSAKAKGHTMETLPRADPSLSGDALIQWHMGSRFVFFLFRTCFVGLTTFFCCREL
jgi:hypothetical protein